MDKYPLLYDEFLLQTSLIEKMPTAFPRTPMGY
jgi:hypothetical protein